MKGELCSLLLGHRKYRLHPMTPAELIPRASCLGGGGEGRVTPLVEANFNMQAGSWDSLMEAACQNMLVHWMARVSALSGANLLRHSYWLGKEKLQHCLVPITIQSEHLPGELDCVVSSILPFSCLVLLGFPSVVTFSINLVMVERLH